MINAKMVGIVAAAFMAGAFFASPELRAYASTIANDVICTGCVGTSDLAGSAVTNAKLANGAVNSAKLADDSITASDLAPDSVGASELQGVTKLLFGQCVPTNTQKTTPLNPGLSWIVQCNIAGVDNDDSASATLNDSNECFEVRRANPTNLSSVSVSITNDCPVSAALGSIASIAVMVYDK